MRKFIAGDASDSTVAATNYLKAHRQLILPTLYVIKTGPTFAGFTLGKTFLLTDYPAPLRWNYKGTFIPTNISRGSVESKIGFEADTVDVNWFPQDSDVLVNNPLLTVLQGFRYGIFDNAVVEIWQGVMPTVGDCNTYGAALLFSGRIGDIEPDRLGVKMHVISRMETLNIQVPTNLIEPTNMIAEYTGGKVPPGGPTSWEIQPGTSIYKIYGAPVNPDPAFSGMEDIYSQGYVAFQSGNLGGLYCAVRKQAIENGQWVFYLYEPLPLVPANGDLFGAFIRIPLDIFNSLRGIYFGSVTAPIPPSVGIGALQVTGGNMICWVWPSEKDAVKVGDIVWTGPGQTTFGGAPEAYIYNMIATCISTDYVNLQNNAYKFTLGPIPPNTVFEYNGHPMNLQANHDRHPIRSGGLWYINPSDAFISQSKYGNYLGFPFVPSPITSGVFI